MSVPALLVDFPAPASPAHPARARLLGRQWAVFWRVGTGFFRPLGVAGALGYGWAAWAARARARGRPAVAHYYCYAAAAACHVVILVHTAVNLQPLNARLEGLKAAGPIGRGGEEAEAVARRWMALNLVRLVMPVLAGGLALWGALGGEGGERRREGW